MSSEYKYVLRFTVAPGHLEDERIDDLVTFCLEGKVAEVMFFVLPEELNTGHASDAELDEWMAVIAKGQKRLEEIGVITSINPWMTTLHTDRGRNLKPGQNFRTMVDPVGYQATAVACPLDKNWRDALCRCYARYAEIRPNVIWIEDDFRLHNHAPLKWGGCFCDAHMEEYSRRAGKKLTREEFVAGVVARGEPHPYRKIWLDVSRETMAGLAGDIARAVHAVDPGVRLGLMTSDPAVHCAEARDWKAIMDNLTGDRRPCVRIHLPAYSECASQDYGLSFQYVSRLTKALLPDDIEIYPELENFPDTRYAKSRAFTAFQIETSAQIASRGITMNIYDMMGNGIMAGEGYQRALAEIKPFMDMTVNLGLEAATPEGVVVPVNPDASYSLHTGVCSDPGGLYPSERAFAGLLSAFSIANRYETRAVPSGGIAAISGQYLRALSAERVERLFNENCLLLDGEAVLCLKDMGLLRLIGAKDAREMSECDGMVSFEEIVNGAAYAGVERARMTAQISSGSFVAIEYDESAPAEIISEVRTPENAPVAPGMALVGGSAFILPYRAYPSHWGAHKNTVRRDAVLAAIERMSAPKPAYAVDAPYVQVYSYSNARGKRVLALVNTSGDDYESVTLRLPDENEADFTLYAKSAPAGRAPKAKREGRLLTLSEPLKRLESVFLTY